MNQPTKKKNDLSLKIFALIIAILLWVYVMDEVNPITRYTYRNIDLEFSNSDNLNKEGLKLLEPQEAKVSVQVRGKKSDIDSFSQDYQDNIKAVVDLGSYTEGQMKLPVKVSLKNQINGIEILDYEPKEVLVTFDKFITKEMPITLRTIGELEESYVLGSLDTKSETVLLKGPKSYIEQVDEVVGFINLENRKASSPVNIQLRILDKQGNDIAGIEKQPSGVDVDIEILRSKTVPVELITDQDIPEGYEMKEMVINPSRVTLKGDESVLDIKTVETKEISMEELISKDQVVAQLKLPEGIKLVDSKEEIKVSLNVLEFKEKNLNYKIGDLQVKNLADNLQLVEDEQAMVRLVIVGDSNKIANITESDLVVSIDLKDLEEGDHDLPLEVENIPGINIKDINPKSIKVKLKPKE